jgi:hypothetical protein
MSSQKKECSYIYDLEKRVSRSYGWEVRNGNRYFSLNFKGGFLTYGNKTLKQQLEDYFSLFDNVNPEITNYNETISGDYMCGVKIFMTEDEHTIYKEIIDKK